MSTENSHGFSVSPEVYERYVMEQAAAYLNNAVAAQKANANDSASDQAAAGAKQVRDAAKTGSGKLSAQEIAEQEIWERRHCSKCVWWRRGYYSAALDVWKTHFDKGTHNKLSPHGVCYRTPTVSSESAHDFCRTLESDTCPQWEVASHALLDRRAREAAGSVTKK